MTIKMAAGDDVDSSVYDGVGVAAVVRKCGGGDGSDCWSGGGDNVNVGNGGRIGGDEGERWLSIEEDEECERRDKSV
ncbi:hypothetical protein Tco_0595373 [Tanacetum coccineum]